MKEEEEEEERYRREYLLYTQIHLPSLSLFSLYFHPLLLRLFLYSLLYTNKILPSQLIPLFHHTVILLANIKVIRLDHIIEGKIVPFTVLALWISLSYFALQPSYQLDSFFLF
ncbi:hypothetical protein EYC84_006301 [Monilinia fructicola]|uniref:Uncharacterized protein n=1 Tax=Monilinia fructicola TaxID=38448 RepID=A0A5M9K2X8_MONFR|nr:hypothetical protein EYC84_006301 [Monilinia fructicola]